MCMRGMDIEAMETCKREYNYNVSQLGDPDMKPYCNIDHCWNTVKKKNIHIGLCSKHIDEHEVTTVLYEAATDHHQQVRAQPQRHDNRRAQGSRSPVQGLGAKSQGPRARTRSPLRLQSSSAIMRRHKQGMQQQLREVAVRLARISQEMRGLMTLVNDIAIDDEDL